MEFKRREQHAGEHGRAAAVCLGLLCLLLLVTPGDNTEIQTGSSNPTEEGNPLQTCLNNVTQLQMKIDRLEEEKKEMVSHICPDGWTYFNSSCYFKSSESKNWNESRQDCLGKGADLVIINSREENSFLKNSGLTAWVGLSDLETEGEWKWVDGSSLSYKYWAKGQPDDYGGEDCGEVRPTRDGWNDLPCSERLQWICEKRIPVHPPWI
ncbi:CD209 antigen-like protein C isoform X2 [Myripristis murdjan]|uniref:CD209 antigen-like protein C isoform X2 n=1 Tax=Myripristis murdjan TaxID=586833 RepID=UPI0011760CA6|nr:CD209 antigen-like protein C isoform X2 [Myripristis murdjan]